MSARVLFATIGSLGDLHPYIAVALELKRRGIEPVIASTDRYRALVESNGIVFFPLSPGEAQLGDASKLVARAFHPVSGMRYLVDRVVMAHVRESYDDLEAAAGGADLIVTHPLAVTGVLVAEKRRIPWASSVLAPLSLLSVADPPLFAPAPWMRSLRRLGETPYRLAFDLARASCRRWERPLRALRAELGLPPTRTQALFEGQYSPLLNLALFPSFLARHAPDWPPRTEICGFARYDGTPEPDDEARIERFLDAGEPPLVFALGSSAVMIAGGFWHVAVAAARRLERRSIVLTGGHQAAPEGDDVLGLGYVPYSRVFPRAAAVVHHAGVGTLAQALAAGRPQLMLPLSFDQPDNAERAARLGAGRVLPFAKADARRLERELRELLDDFRYERSARELSTRAAEENGAIRASEALQRLLQA